MTSPPGPPGPPPPPPSGSAFPVTAHASGRYLVDSTGTPFPILGRTAWFVISLAAADYQAFINDSVNRSYNAIEMHVIDHDPRGSNPPFAGNGALPFLKRLDGAGWGGALSYGDISAEAPDFSTPNETYWAFVDSFLAYCESKGVLVFFFPAYMGFDAGEQGWGQEIVANGANRMQTYGAFLANRYKNQKNIVWMMGGDIGTGSFSFSAAQTNVENALLTGLRSVAGQQSTQFSAEWNSESIATDQTSFGSAMTLNGAYSFTGDVNNHGRRGYAHTPAIPSYLLEEPYDEEGPDGNNYNPSATQPVRRFQWWGWLSTIGGYISGNGFVWPFVAPAWRKHLDTQGSRDMGRLNAFIRSIRWWELVPSGLGGMKTLVTSGGGEVSSDSYVAAAANPAGNLLVAYLPPARAGSIAIDMTAMSGTVRARWFDPATAAYTTIGTFANTGTHTFAPPAANGAGQPDWALVLDLG